MIISLGLDVSKINQKFAAFGFATRNPFDEDTISLNHPIGYQMEGQDMVYYKKERVIG
jgi:hypothetical protein